MQGDLRNNWGTIGFKKGAQEGRQEGELTLVLRPLARRIGFISAEDEVYSCAFADATGGVGEGVAGFLSAF